MATQADAIATYLAELTVVEDDVPRHARERAAAEACRPYRPTRGFLRFKPRAGSAPRRRSRSARAQGTQGYGSPAGWRPRASSRPSRPTPAISGWPRRPTRRPPSRAGSGPSSAAPSTPPRLTDGGYDLAFLDAKKSEYPEYLEHALRLVRPGGVIIADNVLRVGAGRRPEGDRSGHRGAAGLWAGIAGDDRLDSVILTVGDGLAVSWMRRHEELEA